MTELRQVQEKAVKMVSGLKGNTYEENALSRGWGHLREERNCRKLKISSRSSRGSGKVWQHSYAPDTMEKETKGEK